MKRKEFIKKTAAASVILSTLPILNTYSFNSNEFSEQIQFDIKIPDDRINQLFKELLQWVDDNGWLDFLQSQLKLNLQLSDITINELKTPISSTNLAAIRKEKGFEDFAGSKLIEPGQPALSLLYHMIASPRVKSKLFKQYPDIYHIDNLENYIYNIAKIDFNEYEKENLYLAVLAYEYRPAFKTPPFEPKKNKGKRYAQFVYSRCGIGRIGEESYNYNRENRCFTSKPVNEKKEKQVAVTPAKYGLFLISLKKYDDANIRIMNEQKKERSTSSQPRYFISPITKIVESENISFEFGEYHINEKLKRLSDYKNKKDDKLDFSSFNTDQPPFIRTSCKNDLNEHLGSHKNIEKSNLVEMTRLNSSVILSSVPNPIIRFAKQNGKLVNFLLPEEDKSERRYGALKLPNPKGKELYDAIWTDFFFRRKRRTSRFRATRNAPLFANIKFVINDCDECDYTHLGGDMGDEEFMIKIKNGNYKPVLFEDSICDGCISINFKSLIKNDDLSCLIDDLLTEGREKILSAFSLVTAPDFFPNLDSNDIRSYYYNHSSTLKVDEDFLEGGTLNLSGIRQRGNPALRDPFDNDQKPFTRYYDSDKSFDTTTAVIGVNEIEGFKSLDKFNSNYKRDYQANSYLPDTGTGIFYPGWDATYSGDKKNPFFATYGLGSPFPEDMKLCAAANGMWPVLSPDAGRTFQGSLEPFPILGKPNTSIPLMDEELGFNKNSPYVKDFDLIATHGWDGEQGPFIEIDKNSNVLVNYTDINRADYLENLLDESVGFDMSKLRKIDTVELIKRMECLRKCIKTIDNKPAQYTKMWLVGASKITNWDKTQKIKCLPKVSLFNNLDFNNRQNPKLNGDGYFFVFVRENKKPKKGILINNKGKRRTKKCKKIWLCQITKRNISYSEINLKKNKISPWEIKNFIIY